MNERYHFEYPRPGECLIFDRTLGTASREEPIDARRAVITCKDPDMAQRIVDFLNGKAVS